MAYITQTDLTEELGVKDLIELTTDDLNATVPDALVIAKAIAFAEGTFESYARTRYSLPVPATPLVKTVCVNLAVYHLFRRRATDTEGIFKVRKTAYDEAIKTLTDLQSGKAALDVPAVEETVQKPANPDKILTNAANNKFTNDKLHGF